MGRGLGTVGGRAFGEMVPPASVSSAASVPRSQEACSIPILDDKDPGSQGAAPSPGPLHTGLGTLSDLGRPLRASRRLLQGLSFQGAAKSRHCVHFTNEETRTQRVSDLPKTQLVRAAEGSRPRSGDS